MRLFVMPTTLLIAACGALSAQTPDSPELREAQAAADQVRELVEAGALPPKALREAQLVLDEARDEAILSRTLYGSVALHELTEAEATDMLDAAERLVERQSTELGRARLLVREGAAAKTTLVPYEEELAERQRTLELAKQRATLFEQLAEMVRIEEELIAALARGDERANGLVERYGGSGVFLPSQFRLVKLSYFREFHNSLPISAEGDTALHRSMGFDHSGRVDVAVHPDTKEGKWLRRLLEGMKIPYFAFRSAMASESTGAHIHIGPPSLRLKRAD